MSRLDKLRSTSTKSGFADVLGVSAVFLTRCLYINKPENQYHQFTIDKKSYKLAIERLKKSSKKFI